MGELHISLLPFQLLLARISLRAQPNQMKKKLYTLCILACLLNPATVSSGRPITDELGSEHTDDLNNITDNKNHDGTPGLAQVKISQSPIAAAETSPVKTASNPAKKSITKNNDIALSAKFTIEELTDYRQQFLEAEKALAKNNIEKYFLLADELKEYPLYPYLQYKWLKKNLDQEEKIKQFSRPKPDFTIRTIT